ncbi:MAG TPA: hypothetical protein VFF24_06895 [Acidimicrobiia bacterium]|nr:hypothetical protein [Acidimicrobiia bacterium]
MRAWNRGVAALLLLAAVPLSGCAEAATATATKPKPYTLEKQEGTSITRLRIEQRVFDRIRIKTSTVRDVERFGGETARKVVDYSAIVYDPKGDTIVYTNPSPLVFVRQSVKVDSIDGDLAVLTEGPPVGTAVVTVGTAELLGMETGVGK